MERRIEQLKKKESALSEVLLRIERERAAALDQKRKRELTTAQESREKRQKQLEQLKAAQASLESEVMEDEKRIKSLLDDVGEANQ
jgi:membrane protein involved in colicin uptake